MLIDQILALPAGSVRVADIGAAFYGEVPPYQRLLDTGLGRLFAFELDSRYADPLRQRIGSTGTVFDQAIGDGHEHTLYLCDNGWTSLLEPDPDALAFFNTFPILGRVRLKSSIATRRLDDIDELPQIDFLKMDVQGSELSILQNGRKKLSKCVATQIEISFIPLYKNQPPFGLLDTELRSQGFIPHRFMDIKRWPITPTVRNNDPRQPFNQLLEGDIVYIRDIIHPANLSDEQLKKLAAIAHYVFNSPDLEARCIIELQNRSVLKGNSVEAYLQTIRAVADTLDETSPLLSSKIKH
jgi:FkbM family methyltransferase